MKLPDGDRARVDWAKITDYLLSETHERGRHKAVFFLNHGFPVASPFTLIDALVRHAQEHEVTELEVVPFGTKYVVEGVMQTPDGRSPIVRSVWIIENSGEAPRFVTAYPGTRLP